MPKSGKLNVAILMGGRSAEYDISLRTGRMVTDALDRDRYNVKPVLITKEGRWFVPKGYLGPGEPLPGVFLTNGQEAPGKARRVRRRQELVPAMETHLALQQAAEERIDVVFIAMHGPFGEDGTIQGLLEVLGLPYTGSDVAASALAMDKVRCKEIFACHGIPTPRHVVVREREWADREVEILGRVLGEIGFPCVAKVPRMGSSVGLGIAEDHDALRTLMPQLFRYDDTVMIEEYVRGTEITCAVLGTTDGSRPQALPVTEIVPRTSAYFDYRAKYTPGASEEITPARLDPDTTRRAQEIAVRVHEVIGCGSMSRTDMIVEPGSEPPRIVVLETNTIPGMTETSLLPQAAQAVGIAFPQLVERIIDLALFQQQKRKHYYEIA